MKHFAFNLTWSLSGTVDIFSPIQVDSIPEKFPPKEAG